ncbi:hypothetical protein BDP27DRAFT_1425414 [Rhodocollybia butyracea]|uniref:CxC2-like cysteine cluster KDZ transposase-associated domain-containing protein n=1 Tax=Rhodocollybia butyracea TaxID=206335 RepID=A0A9P5PK35_9AGAR|nr:hypothetical protein BDP27DRAFT_1425414 [Rhodocollybia butyracea]
MSKVSAEELYHTLERQTDNTGTSIPPMRLREFCRMIREFCCVRTNKRFGFGHHPEGVDAAIAGDLAMKCPACPYPGINLPPDWESTSKDKRWVYKLFTLMDGNMKAVRLNASSEARDPGLNVGRAFFLNPTAHRQHVEVFDKHFPNQKSTCNDHKAVNSGTTAREQNCTVTGVFSVFCARHDTFRLQGTTDLRVGERQVDVNFAYINTLRYKAPTWLTSTYDVFCQHSVNFFKHIEAYPPSLQPPQKKPNFQFLVPKFHLNAHAEACRVTFSLNWSPFVGQTDGECPERCWSETNVLAGSTKRMGPGLRWDTMDNHFGDHNWRKATSMVRGNEVLKKHSGAVITFEGMSEGIADYTVKEWLKMVLDWEEDSTKPNPFVATVWPLTYHKVRLDLAKKDEQRARDMPRLVDIAISPLQLIVQGLELGEQQRCYKWDSTHLESHATPLQQTKIREWSATLRRRIDAWFQAQHFHMPAARILRNHIVSSTAGSVSDIPLLLPSAVMRGGGPCSVELLEIEWKLRASQGLDELENLRKYLLSRTAIIKHKLNYGHGQYDGLRSAKAIETVNAKINACAARYRLHRMVLIQAAPLLRLSGTEMVFKELEDKDIRGIDRDAMDAE